MQRSATQDSGTWFQAFRVKTKCGKDCSSFLKSREIGVAGPAPQGDRGLEMEAAATCWKTIGFLYKVPREARIRS